MIGIRILLVVLNSCRIITWISSKLFFHKSKMHVYISARNSALSFRFWKYCFESLVYQALRPPTLWVQLLSTFLRVYLVKLLSHSSTLFFSIFSYCFDYHSVKYFTYILFVFWTMYQVMRLHHLQTFAPPLALSIVIALILPSLLHIYRIRPPRCFIL